MRGLVTITTANYNGHIGIISICVAVDVHPYSLPDYAYDLMEKACIPFVPDEEGIFIIQMQLEEILDVGFMKAYKLTGNKNNVYGVGLGIEGIRDVSDALTEFITKSSTPIPPVKDFNWDEILKNDN